MEKKDKTGSILMCGIVFAVIIATIYFSSSTAKHYCIEPGCRISVSKRKSYCYKHVPYMRPSDSAEQESTKKESSPSSSTTTTTTTPTKNSSSWESYDDGYNDVYEDDDYDWDRYWSDDEYASGVDDAMEDEDW